VPSSAESGGGQAVKESRHRWIVENALPRRRGGTKKKKTLCLCVLVVYSFSHHKDTKKRKTLYLCDLVVFHAAGHAVEGQFVVDVGAEGHGVPQIWFWLWPPAGLPIAVAVVGQTSQILPVNRHDINLTAIRIVHMVKVTCKCNPLAIW